MKSLIFILCFFSSALFADSATYTVELISAFGADKAALSAVKNQYAQAKSQNTDPEQSELLTCMVNQINLELIQQTLAPVYAKIYSENDANEIISFFNSDLGKRLKRASTGELTKASFEKGLSIQDKQKLQAMNSDLFSPKRGKALEQAMYKLGQDRKFDHAIQTNCQP